MNSFANLRDVARGLPVGTLREGLLLRSDAPLARDASPQGVPWPPVTVVDLRHPSEKSEEHPLAGAATVHELSLVDPALPGPGGPRSGSRLGGFYDALLGAESAGMLIRAVDAIAAAPGPVLVHCVAGKDRTGVTVALVLRLLGVPAGEVAAEYLLTNFVADRLAERLRLHYSLLADRERDAELVTVTSVAAPHELIARVLVHWDEHPGGTLGWYRENGGTDAVVARLGRLAGPAVQSA